MVHHHISACQASLPRLLQDLSPRQVQRGYSTSGISYVLDIDMYSTVQYFTCELSSKNRLGKINGEIIDTNVNLRLLNKLFELCGI